MIFDQVRSAPVDAIARLATVVTCATRLEILLLLAERPAAVGDICARLDLSQPLISHHLAALRNIGAVRASRHKRSRVYALGPGASVTRSPDGWTLTLLDQRSGIHLRFDSSPDPSTAQRTMARSWSASP